MTFRVCSKNGVKRRYTYAGHHRPRHRIYLILPSTCTSNKCRTSVAERRRPPSAARHSMSNAARKLTSYTTVYKNAFSHVRYPWTNDRDKKLSCRRETARQPPTWMEGGGGGVRPPAHSPLPPLVVPVRMVESESHNVRTSSVPLFSSPSVKHTLR